MSLTSAGCELTLVVVGTSCTGKSKYNAITTTITTPVPMVYAVPAPLMLPIVLLFNDIRKSKVTLNSTSLK
jgi:hypothetical protein